MFSQKPWKNFGADSSCRFWEKRILNSKKCRHRAKG